jgi:hypothetical protein
MADVGPPILRKELLPFALLVSALALQGCASGEITAEQQRMKKAALQKVADDAKDPNRQVRPQ